MGYRRDENPGSFIEPTGAFQNLKFGTWRLSQPLLRREERGKERGLRGERREERGERGRKRERESVLSEAPKNQKMGGLQNRSFSKANFLYKRHFFRGSCGGPHKASFSRVDYGYVQRVRERRGEEMQRAIGEMRILVRSLSQQVHFRISSLVRGVCLNRC